MYEEYPWLCDPTQNAFDKSACKSTSAGNIVSDDEADNAQVYTTEAFGTFGLKFTYYKVSLDTERDKLYAEDQLQKIERAFYFIGYLDQIPPNVLTYQLQGIWGEDVVTVNVGRAAFQYWSTYGGKDRNTPKLHGAFEPRIGDVVYLEPNDTFYEIYDVKYYQNAFGLKSQTYTLTLRVYKDCKYSISTNEETLSDIKDPIYDVAPSGMKEQFNFKDPLMLNDELKNLPSSRNVNMMDPLFRKNVNNSNTFDPFNGW